MNSKEALNKLKEIEKDYTFSKIGTCFHVNCDELQELVNKYQEIQNVYFKNEPMESADLNGEKLQELYNFINKLSDKATPKKLIKINVEDNTNKFSKNSLVDLVGHFYNCPNCNSFIGAFPDKYCKYCGQALDWSKEDE